MQNSKIYDRLIGKPHLIPMETNVYHIPERLKQYDPRLFVVFNVKKQWFELHSLANKGNSFSLCIPYSELDARAIYLAKRNNIHIHGKKLFREIDEHNEQVERAIKRHKKNEREAMAKDMRPLIKKLAEV